MLINYAGLRKLRGRLSWCCGVRLMLWFLETDGLNTIDLTEW